MEKNFTLDGKEMGLQVSKIENIPTGVFYLGLPFYIKNNTNSIIEIQALPIGNTEPITTSIFPGWNPEMYIRIVSNTSDKLQWGR